MKSKFTPGPWEEKESMVIASKMGKVKFGDKNQFQRSYIVCQPYLCSDPGHKGIECDENKYNTKLIASAPELLKALQFCVKMLDDENGKRQGIFYSDALAPDSDDVTAIEYLRGVVNKAEGGDK